MKNIGRRHGIAGAMLALSMVLATGCAAQDSPGEPDESLAQDAEAFQEGCTCNHGELYCLNANGFQFDAHQTCSIWGGTGACQCSPATGTIWCTDPSSGNWVNKNTPCGGGTSTSPGYCTCNQGTLMCLDNTGSYQNSGPCPGGAGFARFGGWGSSAPSHRPPVRPPRRPPVWPPRRPGWPPRRPGWPPHR